MVFFKKVLEFVLSEVAELHLLFASFSCRGFDDKKATVKGSHHHHYALIEQRPVSGAFSHLQDQSLEIDALVVLLVVVPEIDGEDLNRLLVQALIGALCHHALGKIQAKINRHFWSHIATICAILTSNQGFTKVVQEKGFLPLEMTKLIVLQFMVEKTEFLVYQLLFACPALLCAGVALVLVLCELLLNAIVVLSANVSFKNVPLPSVMIMGATTFHPHKHACVARIYNSADFATLGLTCV